MTKALQTNVSPRATCFNSRSLAAGRASKNMGRESLPTLEPQTEQSCGARRHKGKGKGVPGRSDQPQPLNSSFHFLFHYPNLTPIYYSSFHFIFLYPHIATIYFSSFNLIFHYPHKTTIYYSSSFHFSFHYRKRSGPTSLRHVYRSLPYMSPGLHMSHRLNS